MLIHTITYISGFLKFTQSMLSEVSCNSYPQYSFNYILCLYIQLLTSQAFLNLRNPCCLRCPATLIPSTLSLKRPELSPRPQQTSHIDVSRNLILVLVGLRKPQTSLRPSRYFLNRIGSETNHKCGLITSILF